MSVIGGQLISFNKTLQSPTTGGRSDATSGPTAALYINGTLNAATVTVAHVSTGIYKYSVTLPALVSGDFCQIIATATVGIVSGDWPVWEDGIAMPDGTIPELIAVAMSGASTYVLYFSAAVTTIAVSGTADDGFLINGNHPSAVTLQTSKQITITLSGAAVDLDWIMDSQPNWISTPVALGVGVTMTTANAVIATRMPQTLGTVTSGIATLASEIFNGVSAIGTLLGTVKRWLQLMMRKDAAIATDYADDVTEINADEGSGAGSFDNTTDSQQAIADNAAGGNIITIETNSFQS